MVISDDEGRDVNGGISSRNWRQIFTKVACILQHLDGQVGTVVNPKEERIGQLVPRSHDALKLQHYQNLL